jgi:Uma2 family endonuclease
MSIATTARQTLDDLMRFKGKAELIQGKIVPIGPAGVLTARFAGRILLHLDGYAGSLGRGEVFGANVGYAQRPPLANGRESFCPDVSYFDGALPTNLMKFISGSPTFAVEIRSENDYGRGPDREYEEKRDDYFAAGTQVVWDVDPKARTIACYRAATPTQPTLFQMGGVADAEPAVPGWRPKVTDLLG